jgi:hypothetical protein
VGLFEEILLNYFERNRYITVHPHAIIEQWICNLIFVMMMNNM